MKTAKITFFVALSILFLSKETIAQDATESIVTKDITIKHVDDLKKNNPIPDSYIYFGYLDIIKSVWVTNKQKTDASGVVNFKIPLRKDGSSYCFIFSTSEDDFNATLNQAKAKKILLTRIPAMEKGNRLEIWVDNKDMKSNKNGMVQMWSE